MPELTWLGKDAIRHHHQQVPYRPLHLQYSYPAPAATPAPPGPPAHRLIHGDNLDALKSLLPEFEGRVKCIYIDPPYNTGNEGWAYNDNVSDPALLAWLGQVVGPEGDDLSRHDKWLCMMYPRLKLLHRLLSPDGAIFVSIDDNEVANLRLVMDEIWGAGNFVANIIWQKRYSAANDVKNIAYMHDYVLCYRRTSSWERNLLPRSEENNKLYKNIDENGRAYRLDNYTCNKTAEERPNLYYPVENPLTGEEVWPKRTRVWAYQRERHLQNVAEGLVAWSTKPGAIPSYKRYKDKLRGGDGVVPTTWWPHEFAGHTDAARKEVRAIFADHTTLDFITPKPSTLIERVLELATDADSIILDSFAGSGTTGHAVLKLNARDGGRRQCLLIEREGYAESLTAERLRRVVQGYGAVPGTGGRFGFYTLGEPLLDADTGLLAEGTPWATLAPYVWRADTGTALPAGATAPRLGQHPAEGGPTYYLHYDPTADTTLDRAWLAGHAVAAPAVVYADACLLDAAALAELGLTFRKIPRDLRLL